MQVKASEFSFAVGKLLNEYSKEVAEASAECTEQTASEMVDELKTKNKGKHTWKKFPRYWTYRLDSKSTGEVTATVHLKKPMYRIGHLLEFGHAVRNGGRTPIKSGKKTFVEGYGFIEPVATKYEGVYEQKMKDMIGGIG